MTSLPSTPMQPTSCAVAAPCAVGSAGFRNTVTVVYFLCDEPIPYSTKVNGQTLTLAQFKELIVKKGNYRYDKFRYSDCKFYLFE